MEPLILVGEILVSDGHPLALQLEVTSSFNVLTEHLFHGRIKHGSECHCRADSRAAICRNGDSGVCLSAKAGKVVLLEILDENGALAVRQSQHPKESECAKNGSSREQRFQMLLYLQRYLLSDCQAEGISGVPTTCANTRCKNTLMTSSFIGKTA